MYKGFVLQKTIHKYFANRITLQQAVAKFEDHIFYFLDMLKKQGFVSENEAIGLCL